MKAMPKKTTTPAPIRPELIAPLTAILAGCRDGSGSADDQAAHQIRMTSAAESLEEAIRLAQAHAYIDGVAEAQYMTGFTDETFQSILDESDYPVEQAGGVPK